MTKAEIRKQITGQKKSVGLPDLKARSAAVIKRLKTQEIYQNAATVGAYAPLPDEVDVTPIMMQPGRTFYIPAFDDKIGSYRLAKMSGMLQRGRFGILEPIDPLFAEEDEIDLILVPGVAFDRSGRRIGRGGGFYDRLLPLYRTIRIGICFDFQLLDAIPDETHDCRMDFLLTESNFIKVSVEH